jgi:hypothetical protein
MPDAFTVWLSELNLSTSGYRPGGFSSRICRAARVSGEPLGLFKEYTHDKRRSLNVSTLEILVRWRHDLPTVDRKILDSFSAYPNAIVRDGEDVAGILMNEAPSSFLQRHSAKDAQPRQAEALGRSRNGAGGIAKNAALYFEPPHKFALLGVLLQRLIWLHDHRVIIGDLQPRNVLVTADIDIRDIYLLDCDSFWLGDLHAFPPHAPEMWRVDEQCANPATDLAKFARLVARSACEDFSISSFPDEELREMLPGQHVRQLQRMWSVDPSLPAERLRSMAHAWTGLVKSARGGRTRMYLWTDAAGRIPWCPPDTHINPGATAASGPTARRTGPQQNRQTSSPSTQVTPRRRLRKRYAALLIILVTVAVSLLAWLVWGRP